MAVLLLEKVQLLEAAVEVGADIVPAIGRIVFVGVTPRICKIDFPTFRSHVCKGIEHMCELVGWEVLRVVVPPINSPGVLLARLYAIQAE